jgi:hypothetical protein
MALSISDLSPEAQKAIQELARPGQTWNVLGNFEHLRRRCGKDVLNKPQQLSGTFCDVLPETWVREKEDVTVSPRLTGGSGRTERLYQPVRRLIAARKHPSDRTPCLR